MFLVSFTSAIPKPVYAGDDDYCKDEFMADIEHHKYLMNIGNWEINDAKFDRFEAFNRDLYLINLVLFMSGIEKHSCSFQLDLAIFGYSLELYRLEANYALGETTFEEYSGGRFQLNEEWTLTFIPIYCEVYPFACNRGFPLTIEEILDNEEPQTPEQATTTPF